MSNLFAGLDVSTQSCKLVVIDTSKEAVIFVHSVNYDMDLPKYGTHQGVIQGLADGVSESDPQMWLEAVNLCFERLKSSKVKRENIKCISVSGQQHGLVALDANNNLARRRSKLWNDFSTQEECEILTESIGGLDKMITEVGNSQRTGYTAAKIFHMVRHEPEIYKKSTTLFLVHNYINSYLTGGVKVMEPGDTSGMALWNPKTSQWSKAVIEAIDSDLWTKLPPVKPSDQSIGYISQELVKRFGFSSNCKIDAGSGDNMYGAVGTGNVQSGIVTISLGTSGTAYSFMKEPFIDPTGEIAAFCDSTGYYLPLLCVSNLANGYNDVLRNCNLTHETFIEKIKKTEVGNGGKLLIPWYVGERTPDVPQAAPIYFGFGLNDFIPEILCRAVLEGHILNLYDGFKRMPIEVKEIRLTGGLSKSSVWCQTIADIFEADTFPVKGEGAALGAALHAAWVWKKEKGPTISLLNIVHKFIPIDEEKRYQPIKENIKVYRLLKKMFHALSCRSRGIDVGNPFVLRQNLICLGKDR